MLEDRPVQTVQPMAAPDAEGAQTIHIRGRSVMALVIAPQWPLEAWLAGLDVEAARAAGLFDQRPVIVNLAAAMQAGGREAAVGALMALTARDIKVIGVEGVEPADLGQTRWSRLPVIPPGRNARPVEEAAAAPAAPGNAPAAAAPSLLIDRPVRSGQSIVFAEGDVTIVGAVASGAEVMAGGSIHVYGPLRGRAIAGLSVGAAARIFFRRLEAELIAVDGRYQTAERWGPEVLGRAVQVRREGDGLKISPID